MSAFPVWKPKTTRDWIEYNIVQEQETRSKLQALIKNKAPNSQIQEMANLLQKRRSRPRPNIRKNLLPSHVIPDIIYDKTLPYYEDLTFEEALRSEVLKTKEALPSTIAKTKSVKKSFLQDLKPKQIGEIATFLGQQVAINLLWPGEFWTNMASTAAIEAGLYAGKKLNLPNWKRYALAGAGALVINIGSRLISSKDDDYNTIEGLHPGSQGMGAKSIRENSDFGSGWDSARALAKSIYKDVSEKKAFKLLRQSPEWKQMLTSAKEVKELSFGVYGTTYLMEGQFKGEAFKFIKKTPKNSFGDAFMEKAGELVKVTDEMRQDALKHEFSAMKYVENRISPSPYGFDQESNSLFMELMPGKTLHQLVQEKANLPIDEILTKINREAEIASKYGVGNVDIHAGNIMFDPATNRVSWIDWGLAKTFDKSSKEISEQASSAMKREISTVLERQIKNEPRFSGQNQGDFFDFGSLNDIGATPVERKKPKNILKSRTIPFHEDKTDRMQQLTRQQIENSFRTANLGARRHRRFTSTINGGTRNLK